jgi:hypothetical protein
MATATLTGRSLAGSLPRAPRVALTRLLFAMMLSVIGAISVYDGYLVIRTGDMIGDFERNPVGLWLIDANHGDPTLFLAAKGAGTAIVLITMIVFYRRSKRFAFPMAYALLLFQVGLLIFLERT